MPSAIHLEMGEPDFATPAHIRQAAAQALEEGYTKYTANAGLPELRSAARAKVARVNDIDAPTSQVTICPGAIHGVFGTLAATCNPGDEVLVAGPAWPNYRMIATLLGLTFVQLPWDTSIEQPWPSIGELDAHRTRRTKALIVNSPANPTGVVLDAATVAAIVDWAREYGVWVVSDEVYDEITFEEPATSAYPLAPDDHVVSVFSFSKTYSMTGWRLGYTVAPSRLAPLIQKTLEPTVSCSNAAAQRAGIAALDGPQDCVVAMREAYRHRRDLATTILSDAGIPFVRPQGAFYLWVDVSGSGRDGTAFADHLLDRYEVAVTPGIAFGPFCGDHVRISLASEEGLLVDGVKRVVAAITEG